MAEGFDLLGPWIRAMQTMQMFDQIKQMKRKRDNPLAAALESGIEMENRLPEGQELEGSPDLLESLVGLHGLNPQQGEQFRGHFKSKRSVASQRRIQDLRTNLGNFMQTWQKSRANNSMTLEMLKQMGIDSSMADLLEKRFSQQDNEVFLGGLQNLMTGFGEFQDDPEVQTLMKGARQQGILGGMAR